MPRKYNIENVTKIFEEYGCKLLETEFINTKIKLQYVCSCGNIYFKNLKTFKRCQTCAKCSERKKYKIEDVKQLFEKNGCKLLQDIYIYNYTLMKYICVCGNEAKISLKKFKVGQRCPICRFNKILKLSHCYKDYIFPSGKIIKIQGYEYLALDELIKIYKEEDY